MREWRMADKEMANGGLMDGELMGYDL